MVTVEKLIENSLLELKKSVLKMKMEQKITWIDFPKVLCW
jgi:hypothetical protein